MARPRNEGETRKLEVTVPARLFDYLCHLAKHSVLGATPNAVAAHLITQEVVRLISEKFHEVSLPPKEED